jgi:nucleoside-diphosphate-sugar epimerase
VNVAVTGGAGQLGTHVLRRLLADRTYKQVLCLDVRPPSLPAAGRLRYVRADVREPAIAEQLAGFDAVVHLAFVVTGWLPRAEFDAINIGGSKNLFEAAARAGVKQIVYASSIAAYGVGFRHPLPIVEDTPRRLQDRMPYSAAKYRVEEFLDGFEPAHPDLAIARLRPSVLMGERMEHPLGDALRGGVLFDVYGLRMPVVWDEDVADAVLLSLEQRARGPFVLCAADSLTPADAAAAAGLRYVRVSERVARFALRAAYTVARARGKPATDPAWLAAAGDADQEFSSEKARRELHWRPRFPTARDVFRHHAEVVPRRLDRRLRLFFAFLGLAARRGRIPEEHRHVSARVHLAISGPNGGDVGLLLDGGRLTVERAAPRPPTSIIRLDAATMLALLSGELDHGSAQLTGRIRVEGEPMAGMLLGAIVSQFKDQRSRPGAVGAVARRVAGWFREAA